MRRALDANHDQRAHTARQLGITREELYNRRPTLTGIARVMRNRGLAGLAPEAGGASEPPELPKSETARSQSTLR